MSEENNVLDLISKAMSFQARVEQKKAELASQFVEGEAGAGMVRVRVTVTGDVRDIEIEDKLLSPENKDFLTDLLVAAVNAALSEAKKKMDEEMTRLAEESLLEGMQKDSSQ